MKSYEELRASALRTLIPPSEPPDPAPGDTSVLDALERGPMTAYELADILGTHPTEAANRAYALITQGRVVWHRDEFKYGLAADGDSVAEDPHDVALDILRELGGADELSWRYECEDRGYHFEPDEFREIVEDLVADELVRVIYEDPLIVEERYMEDPGAWGDEWPENPPIYEAADM